MTAYLGDKYTIPYAFDELWWQAGDPTMPTRKRALCMGCENDVHRHISDQVCGRPTEPVPRDFPCKCRAGTS